MKSSGFTLIEVLVAMGIATLAGVLLVVIIVNSAGLFTQQSSKVSSGLSANDTMLELRNSIKISTAVAESFTDGAATYTSDGDELVLKVPSVDGSGNLIENTFDHFIFSRQVLNLRFKVFPDALSTRSSVDRIFATSVDFLEFRYFSAANPPVEVVPKEAAKVKITLTLKQKNGLNFETLTSTSEANLRND